MYSSFVQPAITCSGAKDLVTSNWVGLDGFENDTVEQDGTAAYCAGPGNHTPKYYAWIELFPLPVCPTIATVAPAAISRSMWRKASPAATTRFRCPAAFRP